MVALSGPVADLRAAREFADAEWTDLFADAGRRLEGVQDAARWLDDLRTSGLLRRLARGDVSAARSLMESAAATVLRLPVESDPDRRACSDRGGKQPRP